MVDWRGRGEGVGKTNGGGREEWSRLDSSGSGDGEGFLDVVGWLSITRLLTLERSD